MTTILDTVVGPGRRGRAIPKRRTGRTRRSCANPTGSGPRARLAGLPRDDGIVREHGLVTVCEEAGCPNIGECWSKHHATFMIMGDTCTRACAFCNVRTGLPGAARSRGAGEGRRRGREARPAHVVVTSVDRDDLDDGGAGHFAATIAAIRARAPADDRGADARLPAQGRRGRDGGRGASPTSSTTTSRPCPSKYLTVRPGARYFASLRLLQQVKELDPTMFTKSGIMVGLGEERNEVLQLMDDLRARPTSIS